MSNITIEETKTVNYESIRSNSWLCKKLTQIKKGEIIAIFFGHDLI